MKCAYTEREREKKVFFTIFHRLTQKSSRAVDCSGNIRPFCIYDLYNLTIASTNTLIHSDNTQHIYSAGYYRVNERRRRNWRLRITPRETCTSPSTFIHTHFEYFLLFFRSILNLIQSFLSLSLRNCDFIIIAHLIWSIIKQLENYTRNTWKTGKKIFTIFFWFSFFSYIIELLTLEKQFCIV